MKIYEIIESGYVCRRDVDRIKYTISESGCWEIFGRKAHVFGYYDISRGDKKSMKLHRYIFTLFKGEIPEGKLLRHTCDNKACINPAHLIPGTTLDNVADRQSRNRQAKGEKQGKSKITEAQAMEIIEAGKKNRQYGIKQFAEKFGISEYQVSSIKLGRSWMHLHNQQTVLSELNSLRSLPEEPKWNKIGTIGTRESAEIAIVAPSQKSPDEHDYFLECDFAEKVEKGLRCSIFGSEYISVSCEPKGDGVYHARFRLIKEVDTPNGK